MSKELGKYFYVKLSNGQVVQAVSVVDSEGFIIDPSVSVVFSKDIDTINSDTINFDGQVVDLFNNARTEIKDETATTPKEILIFFTIAITTSAVSIFSFQEPAGTKQFSNTTIIGITPGNTEIILNDEAANNQGYNERKYTFNTVEVLGFRLRFSTPNSIFLTSVSVAKNIETVSRTVLLSTQAEEYGTAFLQNAGSSEMNVNGSLAAPIIFEFVVPSDKTFELRQLLPTIIDGNMQFLALNFGGLAALANGVLLRTVSPLGAIQDVVNWKRNIDLNSTMFDFDDKYNKGAQAGRWNIANILDRVIDFLPGSSLQVLIRDDLTGIDEIRIQVLGILKDF